MNQNQKDTFSTSEGDAWYERNHVAVNQRNYGENDAVIRAIDQCISILKNDALGERLSLLEIGCGEGKRLQWLQENKSLECFGIEPSTKAVKAAVQRGVHATKGTADDLPFEKQKFDFVVFGFCLYLCDREDLFQIAHEADRVLKKTGWLIIHDFYSNEPIALPYHHLDGMKSFKMDYRKLWDWNPAYTCFSHKLGHHSRPNFTDDRCEWVAVSVLRKNLSKDVDK